MCVYVEVLRFRRKVLSFVILHSFEYVVCFLCF